ncbi:hypothetical protein [Sphingosinicella sp. BN140058]|uniref:hypothetical protein n=1 Tax=Sphingosinicella sp. BN140058 TaxID=1892855 RepID=UPI00101023D5|nr:hypothetical protein [Sphingosinicella sp. BN140058]QAY80301.1 hypothetical protein ETR14_27035 [Sphingosinicella sp. BN140058]
MAYSMSLDMDLIAGLGLSLGPIEALEENDIDGLISELVGLDDEPLDLVDHSTWTRMRADQDEMMLRDYRLDRVHCRSLVDELVLD